ncbi:MAG: acetyl-CoA carboxylase biotin carboxylase subunit [Candidatus Aminicenantia bacterium]
MFKKVLVANRGEIALRIIRALKELGMRNVIVYSKADEKSLPVMLADEKICIGPPKSSESYLNIPAIISAAEVSGAEAIHPGYGFLSENPLFAEICETSKITFIGPPSSIIQLMGNKSSARQAMKKAGLPIIEGSEEPVSSIAEARKIASRIGFPIILKAVAGGGGKGMRVVRSKRELEEYFPIAQSEAESAFSNPALYIEKFLEGARHIEVQIIGDIYGNVIAVGERECSLQRKHQKIIEETPTPALDERRRRKLLKVAEHAAKEIRYKSLGTFEFLVDKHGDFYFIEANTRIQVEHPITEMVTGIDLVKEQIKIADGERLSIQEEIVARGHSIECRICAEDPETFSPSPGKIDFLYLPSGFGVRVESAIYSGYEIPPYYDSLIAKIIVHAPTRIEAIKKMKAVLHSTIIVGVKTNIPLHLRILDNPSFISGNYDIHFLETLLSEKRSEV